MKEFRTIHLESALGTRITMERVPVELLREARAELRERAQNSELVPPYTLTETERSTIALLRGLRATEAQESGYRGT